MITDFTAFCLYAPGSVVLRWLEFLAMGLVRYSNMKG